MPKDINPDALEDGLWLPVPAPEVIGPTYSADVGFYRAVGGGIPVVRWSRPDNPASWECRDGVALVSTSHPVRPRWLRFWVWMNDWLVR